MPTVGRDHFGLFSGRAAKLHVSGTHRTQPPQAMLQQLAPLLSRFGITRVSDVTGLDRLGVPVTMGDRPNSPSLDVYQGKGLELVAAKVSGSMESIERHQAEELSNGRTLVASLDETRSGKRHTINFPALLRTSRAPFDESKS